MPNGKRRQVASVVARGERYLVAARRIVQLSEGMEASLPKGIVMFLLTQTVLKSLSEIKFFVSIGVCPSGVELLANDRQRCRFLEDRIFDQ